VCIFGSSWDGTPCIVNSNQEPVHSTVHDAHMSWFYLRRDKLCRDFHPNYNQEPVHSTVHFIFYIHIFVSSWTDTYFKSTGPSVPSCAQCVSYMYWCKGDTLEARQKDSFDSLYPTCNHNNVHFTSNSRIIETHKLDLTSKTCYNLYTRD
jgi:hypothetical protein